MAGEEQLENTVTERHFVKFNTVTVGHYNLMVGVNQQGELTGDYTILNSRNGEMTIAGQKPHAFEIMDAYRQGERTREASKVQ